MHWATRVAAWSLAVLLLGPASADASWSDRLSLSGYVRESPFLWTRPSILSDSLADQPTYLTNMIHTRQNLRAYLVPSITLGLELKTRLLTGGGAQELLDLTNIAGGNRTYFDWEHRFVGEPNVVLAMVLDRAWINANAGPVQATFGRQRIAWGTGLVWNPIDIFNPSSPLDFDNEEKPGADAGRAQIYIGPSSKLEVAVAPARHGDDAVAAFQAVLNYAGYDWLALGGRQGPSHVLGGAWAGSVGGGGFRGEFLYSIPRDSSEDPDTSRSCFQASVDGDYAFASSLYLHGAVLYNSCGTTGNAGGNLLLDAYRRRWQTSARLSLFGEVAKDLSALVRADLVGILNPYDLSRYVGPSIRWSASTNVDVTGSALLFGGDEGTEFGDNGNIWMLWVKWSF